MGCGERIGDAEDDDGFLYRSWRSRKVSRSIGTDTLFLIWISNSISVWISQGRRGEEGKEMQRRNEKSI